MGCLPRLTMQSAADSASDLQERGKESGDRPDVLEPSAAAYYAIGREGIIVLT